MTRWLGPTLVCLSFACGSDGSAKQDSDSESSSDAGEGGDGSTDSVTGGDDGSSGDGGDDGSSTDDGGDTGGDTGGGDPPSGLPTGIPEPDFGWGFDTDIAPSIWVDNTNSSCRNDGGTQAEPLCDLFRGTTSATYAAGDVVSILGGPYPIDGDRNLTMNGTQTDPVIIKGVDKIRFDAAGQRSDFTYDGSYGILENIEFFHNTRHGVAASADHLVLRDIEVHNPSGFFIDFNPVVNVGGTQIVIQDSAIYDNRRDNDNDSHGIQAGEGSSHVWILDSELYNNNGDSFQGCHQCFGEPPHHVYIGRNVMHEDRENAVDLKTIHDVVISENVMYGYGASGTSNGDAMVIGSNGFDESINQGPRRVWVINNELRDSANGLRVEGAEDVWIIGNLFTSVTRGIQIDNKEYRNLVIAANTIDGVDDGIVSWNDGCSADSVTLENNLVSNVMGRHLELPSCANTTLANNLMWNPGGGFNARIAGINYTGAANLDAQSFSSMTLDTDPQFDIGTLVPGPGSPAVDAGASLEAHYSTFEASFAADLRTDRLGQARPSGAGPDVGAHERP